MITLATAAAFCLPYLDMVAMLDTKHAEREIMVGRVDPDMALITFAGPAGSWTMVAVGKDKIACVLTAGTDFQIVIDQPGDSVRDDARLP